jgi:hypothetical protein
MGTFIHDEYYLFHALIISFIMTVIHSLTKGILIGHGGKLGTIAFMATLIYFGVINFVY